MQEKQPNISCIYMHFGSQTRGLALLKPLQINQRGHKNNNKKKYFSICLSIGLKQVISKASDTCAQQATHFVRNSEPVFSELIFYTCKCKILHLKALECKYKVPQIRKRLYN